MMDYKQALEDRCLKMFENEEAFKQLLASKKAKRKEDELQKSLATYRAEELAKMKECFESEAFQKARKAFIYKLRPSETPRHLAKHRKMVLQVVD